MVTIFLFLNTSCNKKKEIHLPKIKEYISKDDSKVKQEILSFLKVAGRIEETANYKTDSILQLIDKEPNEGTWLMEAALNLQRYGHFDKTFIETKEYLVEVDNITTLNGEIKMNGNDIIQKYNNLLTSIDLEEGSTKIAQLIDFRVKHIDHLKTSINIIVNYAAFDTLNLTYFAQSIDPNCQYNYPTTWIPSNQNYLDYYVDTSYPQLYNFMNMPPNNQKLYSNVPSTIPWHVINVAKHHLPSPVYGANTSGSTTSGTYIPAQTGTNPFFVPFTNIQIVLSDSIEYRLGCTNIGVTSFHSPTHAELVHKYVFMVDEIEKTLPNYNNGFQYDLVHGFLFSHYAGGNNMAGLERVRIMHLAYLHATNN